ncbi:MAG: hypothetical protein K1X79_06980 [Oligoflexia bacterium]|nr:hypothetical protein [Oligoflexia bacterium]
MTEILTAENGNLVVSGRLPGSNNLSFATQREHVESCGCRLANASELIIASFAYRIVTNGGDILGRDISRTANGVAMKGDYFPIDWAHFFFESLWAPEKRARKDVYASVVHPSNVQA